MGMSDQIIELELAAQLLCESNEHVAGSFKFKVTSSDLDVVLFSKSPMEASLKMAFVLWKSKVPVDTIRCESEEHVYNYKVVWSVKESYPRVVLQSMSKNITNPVSIEGLESMEIISEEIQDDMRHGDQDGGEDLLQMTLRKVFGHETFKPQQKETIISTMSGKTVLSIMGTGGGKSLTFMLPAALAKRPTVVVSPTRSLIDDLMARSTSLGIKSCKFLGEMDGDVLHQQLSELRSFQLIYTTPECLDLHLLEDLCLLDSQNGIERFVFDEAHTICTWGSTFRPKFKEVCEQLAKHQATKLLLSATIPGRVQVELEDLFGKQSWHVIARTVYRENLTLAVKDREPKHFDEVATYIKTREQDCGIIYCVLPVDVSKTHAELLKKGIDCVKYHGQLSEIVKQSSYQKWMSGEKKLIIANASFGMGIDKPDVRYVIHLRLPTSIEEYYQQCGRAGRDGLPSECVLYYSFSDKATLYKLFNREGKLTEQHSVLNELIHSLENVVDCRHKLVMQYFGEDREDFSCLSHCDNCKSRGLFYVADGTNDAMKVVQTIIELGDNKFNTHTLRLILLGSKQKRIQEEKFDELTNFGCLTKKFSSSLLDNFLHQLIFKQILQEKIEVKSRSFAINVGLGPKAHDLIAHRCTCNKYVTS